MHVEQQIISQLNLLDVSFLVHGYKYENICEICTETIIRM